MKCLDLSIIYFITYGYQIKAGSKRVLNPLLVYSQLTNKTKSKMNVF